MKKHLQNLTLLLAVSFISLTHAQALTPKTQRTPNSQSTMKRYSTDSVRTTQSYSSSDSSSSSGKMSVGLASSTGITRASTALTATFDLKSNFSIQTYLSIASTSPFNFGLGGIAKFTFTEISRNAGLHLGGGVGLGSMNVGAGTASKNEVFVHVLGNAGVHWRFSGLESILFSVDGGPVLSFFNSNTDFSVGAYSEILGLSVSISL